MIPTPLALRLQQGLGDFLRTSFASSTPGFESLIDDLVAADGGVSRGPYVNVRLPFVRGSRPDFFPHVPLPFTPFLHQERAFERLGRSPRRHTLVATGTGSGKTESFLVPILDHCRAHRGQTGIKAILIYPMNALATDQAGRIARLINDTPALQGVRAGLYVGYGRGKARLAANASMGPRHVITDHETMQLSPPDILLTNYKMLDYLLVRPKDQRLWNGSEGGSLQYLVVDELHSFDGAQGTDLACLLRRLKERLRVAQADDASGGLTCVGTSATLGGEIDALTRYASEVFGEEIGSDAVVGEVLQERTVFLRTDDQFDRVPNLAHADRLLPEAFASIDEWLVHQAALWLPEPPSGSPGDAAWRVELGEQLRRHVLLDRMLANLHGEPVELRVLCDLLGSTLGSLRSDPTAAQAAVASFLSLVSHARTWRDELPESRDAREARGESRPTDPFLQVQVQLWQRELRRMVAEVSDRPVLRYSDDLNAPGEAARHLPVVHCRECGAMGWATMLDPARPWNHAVRLSEFYPAFFAGDPRVDFLFPAAAVASDSVLERAGSLTLLGRADLKKVEDSDKVDPAEVVRVVRAHSQRTVKGRRRLHRDCPFCGAERTLSLVGFQAATLTSALIDQLYASPLNDDKKLLAFSDSVQDAAHRAGFFGARTWRFNLRVAAQHALLQASADGPVPLGQLPARMERWARQELGMDDLRFLSAFLAPGMAWFDDWEEVQKQQAVAPDADILDRVRRRLLWEVVTEYSLQGRIGRSLPRVGASAASVAPEAIDAAAAAILPRLQEHVGGLRDLCLEELRTFLAGLVHHLLERGAIVHAELPDLYISDGGKAWMFKKFFRHLPAAGAKSRLPVLLTDVGGTERFEVMVAAHGRRATWTQGWFLQALQGRRPLTSGAGAAMEVVLAGLVEAGLLVERWMEKASGRAWGLNIDSLRVSVAPLHLRCSRCRWQTTAAAELAPLLVDGPCLTGRCKGRMMASLPETSYFGDLYSNGDLARIFADEHTGLLERAEREEIELRFKAGGAERRPWDPNLLSCTPTLEMGIDIGDLSSAVLCSVPPGQANYLQRIGRAGRRDGNSLLLTVANARPHDLYFYERPQEMLSGEVEPPGMFLDANAVLERQLAAFCVGRWAAHPDTAADALPSTLGDALGQLSEDDPSRFPANLLGFIEDRRGRLLQDFEALFADRISSNTRARLKHRLEGGDDAGGLAYELARLLYQAREERDELRRRAKRLTDRVRAEKKANPVLDEPTKLRIAEMEQEAAALRRLGKQLEARDTLGFLTDEGLLPNYAFPEAPVRLRSVLLRTRGKNQNKELKVDSYDYTRPAGVALSELAPDNHFYASARRVRIDRVELSTGDIVPWRFCDACPYAEPLRSDDDRTTCPSCASGMWGDPSQVHKLVRMRQVQATTWDRDARVLDDRETRQPRFYNRQMLVQVASADVERAWQVPNPRLPFAFELAGKAAFTDLNFGEDGPGGGQVSIAGQSEPRRGFTLCVQCGTIQPAKGDAKHAPWCKARDADADRNFTDCVFLYRSFEGEALRILLPVAGFGSDEKIASFIAALHLALRLRYGGRVDHLRATRASEPDQASRLRRQYVVLYDSVPGGTGYLRDLALDPQAFLGALEAARQRLVACDCARSDDGGAQAHEQTDGCYRCILAHRQSRDLPLLSRRLAIQLLTDLLEARAQVEAVEGVGIVDLKVLEDSVLERRFLEALKRFDSPDCPVSWVEELVGQRPGYSLRIGTRRWGVLPARSQEPLTVLGCPLSFDFLLLPARPEEGLPTAIFLDGWRYHRDRIGRDLHQRMSLLASGQYDVWSLTWDDIEQALAAQPPDPPPDLIPWARERFRPVVDQLFADRSPSERSRLKAMPEEGSLVWLVRSLAGEVSLPEWNRLAMAGLMGSSQVVGDGPVLDSLQARLEQIVPLSLRPMLATRSDTMLAEAFAPESLATVLALTDPVALAADQGALAAGTVRAPRLVLSIDDRGLDDLTDDRDLRAAWNGVLRAMNWLRRMPHLWSLARGSGSDINLDTLMIARSALDQHQARADVPADSRWPEEVLCEIDDEDVAALAGTLQALGVAAPAVGHDLKDARQRSTGAIAELAWVELAVGVVAEGELEAVRQSPSASWLLFELPALASDPAPLLDAIDSRRTQTDQGVQS